MDDTPRSIPVGATTITVVNVGDIKFNLGKMLKVPESDREISQHIESLHRSESFPSQSVHIALADASIVVDPGDYTAFADTPFAQPGYQPPPDLLAQLQMRAILPEDVTHVVITHAHFDHYSAITIERDGKMMPIFPNARYFLQRADWENPELQQEQQNPDSQDSRTLGVLHKLGLLELVDGRNELVPGLQLIHAPGESPGHQIVRVHSQGQTLYCLGDLYHSTVEAEHPTWMAGWNNRETMVRSRHALAEAALAENALLIAAHIPTVGRLESTASGVRWRPIELS